MSSAAVATMRCHARVMSMSAAGRTTRRRFSAPPGETRSAPGDSDGGLNGLRSCSRGQAPPPSSSSPCRLSAAVDPGGPLPPPLPPPRYSFRRRLLPPNLVGLDTPTGRRMFAESLREGHAESYFPLSSHLVNQSDPAYCGVTTLLVVLNAMSIDPNVRWRGGWRFFGDEDMLLERCCLDAERVRREGVSLEQFAGLARCQGARSVLRRPAGDGGGRRDGGDSYSRIGLEEFRRDVVNAVRSPPRPDDESEGDRDGITDTIGARDRPEGGGCFLVSSFARSNLGQTGEGHFSPVAAYHGPSDACLVLDVARFKYSPYWVPVGDLYDAMVPEDDATGRSRGWMIMYPPDGSRRSRRKDGELSKEEYEGKRPAEGVPLSGTGQRLCPVESIKIDYCRDRHVGLPMT